MASFGLFETAEGEQLLSALLFRDGDGEAALISFLDQPVTMTLADIATDLPGSTFTPVYVVLSLLTGEESIAPGSPIPIDAATLQLGSAAANAGQYALVTTVTDVFGNVDSDVKVANLPAPIQ